MHIDVIVLTKNSEHLINRCLKSIYENVPVKRLIIVDGFSVDNTLKIVDGFNEKYGNIRIITKKGSRAKARETGIREVKTEWFMFTDSDVILCKDWFKKAVKQINNDIGAVWGLNIDANIKNKLFLKFTAYVARKCFNLRGGMHDTLIRRELVEDIRIPEQLHVYEDAYIVNWIKKKGHKVVIGDEIYCLHYRQAEDWNFKESLSLAALEIRCGLIYSHIFRYAFYYPFFTFFWLLQVLSRFRKLSIS